MRAGVCACMLARRSGMCLFCAVALPLVVAPRGSLPTVRVSAASARSGDGDGAAATSPSKPAIGPSRLGFSGAGADVGDSNDSIPAAGADATTDGGSDAAAVVPTGGADLGGKAKSPPSLRQTSTEHDDGSTGALSRGSSATSVGVAANGAANGAAAAETSSSVGYDDQGPASMDPYCVIEIANQVAETSVRHGTASPVWQDTIEFMFRAREATVAEGFRVTVWDKDNWRG